MANDTRSSRGSKDDESDNVRKKPASIKQLSTSGSGKMDNSGLRRSTGEMPLQKQMSSNPSTRSRSEHIDGLPPTTTSLKRKSEIIEKQRISSPLRTSDRGKERLLLGCTGSMNSEKGSGSLDDRKKKLKSEASVKQLMPDAKETSRGEKQHPHTVGFKKKWDGRTYKSLIKRKRRRDTEPDFNEELKRPEVISKIDSSYSGGSVSKPVDDGEDGAENGTSLVDAAASPLSMCKRDNIAGTHVPYSERLRGQRFGNNPEVETHEVGKIHDKMTNTSADPTSPRPRLNGGDSSVPVDEVSQFLPQSTDCITDTLHTSHASASTFPSNVTSLLPEVHMVKSEEGTGLSDVQKTLLVLLNPEISKLCEILQLSEDVKVMVRRFLEYVVDKHQINREPLAILQAFQISLCWIAASLLEFEIDKKASLALAKQHLNFGCTEEEANNVHSKLRLLKKRFKVEVHDFASDRSISIGQVPNREKREKELLKSLKRIQKKFAKQMLKLNDKLEEKIRELNKKLEDESVQIERDHELDLTLVRMIHRSNSVRSEKMKRKEEEHAKKLKEHERHKGILLEKLKAEHFAEMNELKQKEERVLQDVKSWAQAEIPFELPSYGAEFGGIVEPATPNRMQGSEMEPSKRPRTEAVGSGIPIDTPIIKLHPNSETNSVDASLCSSADANEYNGFVDPHFAKQNSDGAPSSEQGAPQCVPDGVVVAEFVKIPYPDVGSNREPDQIEDFDVLVLDPMAVENDAAVSPTNGGSLEESSILRPFHTLAEADSSPQILALHGKYSESSHSTVMHHGDANASENQDVLLQVDVEQLQVSDSTEIHGGDAEASGDQTNNEEALPERVDQHDVCATSGVELPSEGPGASENKPEASENVDVPQQVEVVPLHSTDNVATNKTSNEEPFKERVKQLHSTKSTGTHGDEDARQNQDDLQQVEVEQLQVSNSTEIHDGDAEASGNQTNNEEALPEHVDQHDVSATSGVEQLPSEGPGASENEPEASENVDVPQQVEVVPLHSTGNVATNQTSNEEPFEEPVKQLQSTKSTGTHGDEDARQNQDDLQQVEVEQLQVSDSTEIHDGDAEASGNQTNNEEALPEHVDQHDVSATSGVEQLPSEGPGASENEPEASENVDVPQQVEVVPLHSTGNVATNQTSNEEPFEEHVKQLQSTKSTGTHGDKDARQNQDDLQQVEVLPSHLADTGSIVQRLQTNHDVQQRQVSPSSDSSVDHNQPDTCAASGVELPSEGGLGASQLLVNEPEFSESQNVPHQIEVLPLHSTNDGSTDQSCNEEALPERVDAVPCNRADTGPTVQHKEALIDGVQQLQVSPFSDSAVDHSQPDVSAASRDEQIRSEGWGASQQFGNEPAQQFGTVWVPNQEVSLTQLGLHPPLEGFETHLPLNSAPQMASQQPNYGDPLLNELDRLHKEKENTFKIYEETKLGLKFEFNKEIEEAVARIRRKYEDKFHSAESAFLLKKKELDSNTRKVLMNKILADAFRSKCHALLRSQQAMPSNIMQQHIPSSRPAHGPSRVTGSASMPFVHHSSPPFSTTPAGPPLIIPITPPTINLRVSSEIRAPAPHLQRFRVGGPSSSMPSSSIPSVVPQEMLPVQHVQRNLPTASPSVPHIRTSSPSVPNIPTASPSVPHVRMSSPSVPDIPMTSPLVPHAPSHYDWGRQAEVTGRTPPNLLPLRQDLGLNFGSPDLSQFGSRTNRGGGVLVNVAGSGIATDVVCLSDDD